MILCLIKSFIVNSCKVFCLKAKRSELNKLETKMWRSSTIIILIQNSIFNFEFIWRRGFRFWTFWLSFSLLDVSLLLSGLDASLFSVLDARLVSWLACFGVVFNWNKSLEGSAD
jgi:hypothetical protein